MALKKKATVGGQFTEKTMQQGIVGDLQQGASKKVGPLSQSHKRMSSADSLNEL